MISKKPIKYFRFTGIAILLSIIAYNCDIMSTQSGDIDRPNISGNHLELIADQDTLFVWGKTTIQLYYDFKNNHFQRLEFYINNVKISESNIPTSIEINSNEYEDGFYDLKILIYSKSSPQKIGEKDYIFDFIDSLSAILVIQNTPPQPIPVEAMPVSGKLQINWQKYTTANFQSYKLYKNNHLVALINDPDQDYWRDPDYIGGSARYKMRIEAAGYEIEGPELQINYVSTAIIKVESIDNRRIEFTWSKSIFDSAFTRYAIRRDGITIDSTYDVADTTSIDKKIIFGGCTYQVFVYSSNSNAGSAPIETSYGNKITPFGDFRYNSVKGMIYTYTPTITVYESSTMQIVNAMDQTFLNTAYSYDGESAYYLSGLSLISFDPVNFNTLAEYDLKSIIGKDFNFASEWKVTNNNRVLISGFREGSPNSYYKTYYVDLKTNSVLRSLEGYPYVLDITPDGTYAFLKTLNISFTLFRYNYSLGFIKIRDFWSDIFFRLYPEKSQYILTDNHMIQIFDLSSNDMLQSFTCEADLKNPRIDPTTNTIGGIVSDSLSDLPYSFYRVYDLNDGMLLREFYIPSEEDKFWLADGKVFSSKGYYMPFLIE